MVRQTLLLYISLLCAVAACADKTSETAANGASSCDSDRSAETSVQWSEALAEIEAVRRSANVAGAGIALVSRNDIMFVGGLGLQSLDTKTPVTKNTLFRLGSITKSFTGLTALHRLRSNPNLFTQPVNNIIPRLLNADSGGDLVTLPQLLEHSAGLSDLSRKEFAFQGETVSFEEAIAIDPASRDLRWPAGRHSSYSNAGYGYAGYVLEVEALKPYEQLVERHLLNPLGMKTAGFFITPDSPTLAAGYNTDGKTPIPYWHMIYRSFGGLNATSQDMGRFVKALLQPVGAGQVFQSEEERRRFENPSTTLAAGVGLQYGYGLGNYHWFSEGLRFHGHGGDADGYLSHYGYSVEAGYGYFVVVTAFNKKPLGEMRAVLEKYIASLPALGDDQDQKAMQVSVATIKLGNTRLSELAGHYVAVTRRFSPLPSTVEPELEIRIKNDQLQTRLRGNRLPLTAVSSELFRRPWQPGATYAFVTTDSGEVYLQGDMGNFRRLGNDRK